MPLLGAMVYGIYMNASPEVSSHMQPEAGIMIGLCMISVMLAPVLVLFPIDWIWSSPRGLLVSAAFGIAGGLGFGLFFLGMKRRRRLCRQRFRLQSRWEQPASVFSFWVKTAVFRQSPVSRSSSARF